MLRVLLAIVVIATAACNSNEVMNPSLQTIVGAKLIDGTGRTIDYSIIVIDGQKFRAVGAQADVPVPKDAKIVKGLGFTIEPLDSGKIAPGEPANLIMKGSTTRTMRDGQWTN
jgi:hypothetical protein